MLAFQIKHQYGKFLHFSVARGNYDGVYGIRDNYRSFSRDETIVHFKETQDRYGNTAYQIQNKYGKYLHFNEAKTGNYDGVYGIRYNHRSFFWDETIVHFRKTQDRDGNNAYQIQHQYGKYLHFNEAANGNYDGVYGIRKNHRSFYRDETIVRLIPVNCKIVANIGNFQYREVDSSASRVEKQTLFERKFTNRSDSEHESSIQHQVSQQKTITFKHSSQVVKKWLAKIGGEIEISTPDLDLLKIVPSINCKYTWTNKTIHRFNTSTVQEIKDDIIIDDKIKIAPHSETTYKYTYKKIIGTKIPYRATMKVSCKVDENYVSHQDLPFILYNIGYNRTYQDNIRQIDNRGVLSTELSGEIIPDITEIQCEVNTVSLNN